MPKGHRKILKYFTFSRIAIPVGLGLIVVIILIARNIDKDVIASIDWVGTSWIWLGVAVMMMVLRDVAYMYRIRLLTGNFLSWRKSFDVIMLWEFASSITPSVVGGSAIALFVINREGINLGKTTAIVMTTALLDELFYIVMVPIVFIVVGSTELFPEAGAFVLFGGAMSSIGVFLAGYLFIIALTSIILFGVFFRPRSLKWVLLKIFRIPFLRRWRHGAAKTGDDIIVTSREMKDKSFAFWAKAFLATFISWTARFWVVNCLILCFMPVSNHFLIYARQLIMWVIMLISPTPGSSGVAEYVFSGFLREFLLPGTPAILALLWRAVGYYPYLLIGAIVLPNWLRRVYSRKHLRKYHPDYQTAKPPKC